MLHDIGHSLAAHQPRRQTAARHAAVALILRARDAHVADLDGIELLFIKRAEHPKDPWSGHMGLPGGRVEAADSDALAAVQRETTEEVGIDLTSHGRLLGRLDDLQAVARSRRVDMAITPFVFALTDEVAPTPNEEVEEIHWVTAGELLDPAAASTLPYEHEGTRLTLPCYRVNGRVIWGLTYRMLQSFFEVVSWR